MKLMKASSESWSAKWSSWLDLPGKQTVVCLSVDLSAAQLQSGRQRVGDGEERPKRLRRVWKCAVEECGKIRWLTDLAAQANQHSGCRCLIRVNWDNQSDLGHLHFPLFSRLLLLKDSSFPLELHHHQPHLRCVHKTVRLNNKQGFVSIIFYILQQM